MVFFLNCRSLPFSAAIVPIPPWVNLQQFLYNHPIHFPYTLTITKNQVCMYLLMCRYKLLYKITPLYHVNHESPFRNKTFMLWRNASKLLEYENRFSLRATTVSTWLQQPVSSGYGIHFPPMSYEEKIR